MIQALPGANSIPHSPRLRLYVLDKKINRTERCSDLTAAASFNASARIGRRPLQSNCRRYQTSGCLLSCLIRTELKTAREPHCNPKSMPGRSGKRRHSPTVSAVMPVLTGAVRWYVSARSHFNAAWAAARRAIGTLNGEQET